MSACDKCDDAGTIDDPLSSACGGRPFRYCVCESGQRAADAEYDRRFPNGRCVHGIDFRQPCAECLKDAVREARAERDCMEHERAIADGALTLALVEKHQAIAARDKFKAELEAEQEANALAARTIQDAYERECERLREELGDLLEAAREVCDNCGSSRPYPSALLERLRLAVLKARM
jgi:hypothetical protein